MEFFEELLQYTRKGELASHILDIIYIKPEQPGDSSMIGLCQGQAFIKVTDSITEVLDDCGDLLCTIDTEFFLVNDCDNEYYLMHKNDLYELCDKLKFLLEATAVVFI